MKILLVVSRYPWPPHRGDRLRTVQTLRALGSEHEVTVLAPTPGESTDAELVSPAEELPAGCRLSLYRPGRAPEVAWAVAAAALTGAPLQNGLYASRDLRRKIRLHLPTTDLVILQLVRLAGVASHWIEGPPMVADLIDCLSLNVSRRAALDRLWLRPLLALEARRLARAERRLSERARQTVLVSPRDRRWLVERWGGPGRGASERLGVVPLAMESDPVERAHRSQTASPGNPPTVALTGNLGYFVNADAVCWWVTEVWPELSRARPEVRLVVAGARPSRRVVRRVKEAGGELIPSPPDLRAILARATVAVAPLRGGSGVPVKVLEAWSLGAPAVISPWAAAGTDGVDGEDFLVAETPQQWRAAVLRLIDDPTLQDRLRLSGRRRLSQDHSLAAVQRAWRATIAAAIATGR